MEGDHFCREKFTHLPVKTHPLSLYKRVPLRHDDVATFKASALSKPDLGEYGKDLSSQATVAYATKVLDERAASRDSYLMVRDVTIPDDLAFLKFKEKCPTSDILFDTMLESNGTYCLV